MESNHRRLGGRARAGAVAALLALFAGAAVAFDTYDYTSRARGEARVAEQGQVEIRDGAEGFWYRSVTRLLDGQERRVEVWTGPDGVLVQAIERIAGGVPRVVEIRREGDRLIHRRLVGEQEEREIIAVPAGRIPCAGPSLLALTRRFPFGSGQEREVFFVDFEGHRITGTLRQVGEESVQVPAGRFDCYRLDLILRVFLFRPRIQLWVSRQPPHMLVRQVGKRSALGPVYVTELRGLL